MKPFPSNTDITALYTFFDSFQENKGSYTLHKDELLIYLIGVYENSDNTYIRVQALKRICEVYLCNPDNTDFKILDLLFKVDSNDDLFIITCVVKYLFVFHQRMYPNNNDRIVDRIKTFQNHSSASITSEVYYRLALIDLSKINTQKSLVENLLVLENATLNFKNSIHEEENRSDAMFFITMAKAYKAVLEKDIANFETAYSEASSLAREKRLYALNEEDYELEFYLYTLFKRLYETFSIAKESDTWLDPLMAITVLKDAYLAIESSTTASITFEGYHSLSKKGIIRNILDGIYSNHITHKLPLLSKAKDQDSTLTTFAKYISGIYGAKTNAPLNTSLILQIADLIGNESTQQVLPILKGNESGEELLKAIKPFLNKGSNGDLSCYTGYPQGQDIYNNILADIRSKVSLNDDTKFNHFANVLEEIIRYTYHTHVGFSKNDFLFLFSKSSKGLGEDAKEEDLQNSMYQNLKSSRIAYGFSSEKSKVAQGGRVDIIYESNGFSIPIELKKTGVRPTLQSIKNEYIAQSQTYTSAYDQIGFFILLDLSEKVKTEPAPNIRDWFSIIHLEPSTNLPVKYPDYIISVVIPGNKLLPSKMSTYS